MIDDDPDPGTDPLAGRDPHPRTQIDLWPLHDARQALLEEIVSQPGPSQSPSTRRFLVPVGIAAAIALVAGGAWFVVAGDDAGKSDDQVVASTDSPTDDGSTDGSADGATDPTDADETTEPAEPSGPTRIPVGELRKGDVLGSKQCRDLRGGVVVRRGGGELRVKSTTTLEELRYVVVRRGQVGKNRWHVLVQAGKRWVALDKECTVVSIEREPKLVAR